MGDQNQNQEQWLIKLETEQVRGPYSTEAVIKMILEGIFTGQENIAHYPNGDWRAISKQPEFYEALLESLENPQERDEKKAQKIEAETVIRVLPQSDSNFSGIEDPEKSQVNARFEDELQKLLQNDHPVNPSQVSATKSSDKNMLSALAQEQQRQVQIEIEKLRNLKKDQIKKLFPFFLVAILAILTVVYFVAFENTESSGWALKSPNLKSKDELSSNEVLDLKKKALSLIRTGTFENVLKAQDLMVKAIQGQNKDMESIGLLCSIHQLVWPFTKQTSSDIKAASSLAQYARAVNPISSYSDVCQATNLMVKGQLSDVRATNEKILDHNDTQNFLLYPFVYLSQAEILEESSSLLNAEAYYKEARTVFPNWLWAEFNVGRVLYKQNKYSDAVTIFNSILEKDKSFKAALYGVALVTSKQQGQSEQALRLFDTAFEVQQVIPKVFHLEALQEYINLLIEKKENKKALLVAQYGLKINPAHRAIKEIFISLGGETSTLGETQVSEGISLGDQYFRNKDYLTAQGQYKAAFDFDSKNTSLAIKIAKSLWELNQTREALSWIDKAIQIDPKLFSAYALKSEYLSQKYNFIEAEEILKRAQSIDKNNYEILKAYTKMEFRKHNLNAALLYGERAYKLYNVDVELITLLANIYMGIYLKPGSEKLFKDEKDRIIESVRQYAGKAVDIEPTWPESQITYAKYIAIKDGNSIAELQFKELIKNFPYNVEYRLAFAEFYEGQEKIDQAQEIYKQLVDADVNNIKANLGLARCYKQKREYRLAIKHYMVAAVLDSADVEPLFSVGLLQLDMGMSENSEKDKTAALARFEAVKKINPNFPRIYYFIAKTHYELGLFEQALEIVKIEKQKNPSLADPYILTAQIYMKKEKYEECAEEYQLAIKLRPVVENYIGAAICYRKANVLDLAEEMLGYTVDMKDGKPRLKEGSDASVFREYGYLYELKGNTYEAKRNFTIYLELTAHNSVDAAEIKRKIDNL